MKDPASDDSWTIKPGDLFEITAVHSASLFSTTTFSLVGQAPHGTIMLCVHNNNMVITAAHRGEAVNLLRSSACRRVATSDTEKQSSQKRS